MLCWHFLLKYYVPTIKYINGSDNGAVDTLRSITLINYDVKERSITRGTLDGRYCVKKLDGNLLSLTSQMIDKYQQKKNREEIKMRKLPCYFFVVREFIQIICRSDRSVISTILQKYAVNSYHMHLLHQGIYCTEDTSSKHFHCSNISDEMCALIKVLKFGRNKETKL